MEPVFFTSVVALLLSYALIAECYRASDAKLPQLLNGNTGSTYSGPILPLETQGKSKFQTVNQVLSAQMHVRHITRSVWLLALALVAFALSMSSDMQAVRKSRFVTLTNSAEALSLELLVSDFLNHKDFGPENTLKAYRNSLRVFLEYLGEKMGCKPGAVMFYDMTKPAVEAFRDYRSTLESSATVDLRLASVKAFSRFVSEKYSVTDRARGVRGARRAQPTFKGLKEPQYAALQAAVTRADIRDRFIAELLGMTGIRNNDACNLRLEDIDEEWRFISVHDGKSIEARQVAIPKRLRQTLMTYLDWRLRKNADPKMALIVSDPEKMGRRPLDYRINEKTVWRIINELCLSVGIPKELAHPHTLRHTFARRTLQALSAKIGSGRALKMVQQDLGHTDLKTTMTYLTEDADEAYELHAELT